MTTAVSSIARELSDFTHVVIHGSRNWTEETEKVKQRFPSRVSFIEWKHAGREISLVNDWKAFRELFKILKPYAKKRKDIANPVVVHLHSSKAGFLGRLACLVIGIKAVIYTPHCGAFLRTDIGFLKRKLYRFFEWLGSCFGGRVVGCGQSEAEIYKSLVLFRRKNSTAFVSNGVALKELKEIPASSNSVSSRRFISFTGIASSQKDPAMWSSIAVSSADFAYEAGFSFYWVGDGPEAAYLKRDCIVLTGWKTAEEVECLLEKSAIYFSTAAWEGLPYGVLEAMNTGCALLLRDVPGNRDLVISGENGWLFNTQEEARDRLAIMLKDRNRLEAMGKKSREIIRQNYTLKQMGEGYRKIYSEASSLLR